MSTTISASHQNTSSGFNLEFGEEIEIEEAGFSFRSITGFELEIDCSVYMYSEDGNLEISLSGGVLSNETSMAELNNRMAAEFLDHVGDYQLIESGTDTIQEITGFKNEIKFTNAEEEGLGQALICSPYINQYFFILVIASTDYWQKQGTQVFDAIKSQVSFHPQFTTDQLETETDKHPDLTIEHYEEIQPEEDFLLTIEKGDVSLLLAARSHAANEVLAITEIIAPDGEQLYHYDPHSRAFSSSITEYPLIGANGEVCFLYPRSNQQSLVQGDYRFSFSTETGMALEELQVIIRAGRALDLQLFDINFWLAMENSVFYQPDQLDQFTADIQQALKKRLTPLNLAPGKIEFFQPAPDELETFSSINLDSDLSDSSYMIAESVNNGRALNIGLVDQITQGTPPTIAKVDAISSGSPGMILASASPHTCILIRWPAFQDNIHRLADAIIQQLIVFSGIDTHDIQHENQALTLNREIAWRLRRHPLFYDAD